MTTTTNVTTKMRWIDTGEPHLIPSAVPIRALQTSVCQDPQSECTRLHLELRRIQRDDDGSFHAPTTGGTQLWFDTTTGAIGPVSEDDEPEAAWLRAQIDDEELEPWLRSRWSRQREQIDEAAWRRLDWRDFRFGVLASYTEVLWAAWDTTLSHEGSSYQVEDLHCLDPTCSCQNVCLIFSELCGTKTVDVGRVTVTVPKLKVTEATTPLASTLWAELRARKVLVGQLAQRRRRMKEIGKTVLREGIAARRPEPGPPLVSQPLFPTGLTFDTQPVRRKAKVGRNAPCPCGSGRKYKRCCLGKADASPGR